MNRSLPIIRTTVALVAVFACLAQVVPSSWATAHREGHAKIYRQTVITVRGVQYRVASADRKRQLLVLPIATGIVWTVLDAKQSSQLDEKVFSFDHPLSFPIYETPYHQTNGSLLTGAHLLATVPQKWLGAQEPRLASAWTGWLPKKQVQAAHTPALTSQEVTYTQTSGGPVRIVAVRTERGVTPLFANFLSTRVGLLRRGQTPLAAIPSDLTAVQDGFILTVATRFDPATGANAGMTQANYYYSTKTGEWTPLNQLYVVQTVTGFAVADRQAAFWQQLLPSTGGKVTVGQVWFAPQSLTLTPVWLGNLIMGKARMNGSTLQYQFEDAHPSNHFTSFQLPSLRQQLYQSLLTLPDGRVLSDDSKSLQWRQLSLQLQAQGVSNQATSSKDIAQSLAGNHSQLLSVTTVKLSQGSALLFVNERTAPAAEPTIPTRYEYWLAFLRPDPQNVGMRVAYCLVASTHVQQASTSVLLKKLAGTWVLPR